MYCWLDEAVGVLRLTIRRSWARAAGPTVTSLPFRVWQLSTSSLWQPDECSEWVVTLATAMLSWPSLYILPDSPRWQWAQRALAHTRTHTHACSTMLTPTHAFTCTHTSVSLSLYLRNTHSNPLWNTQKCTLKQCTCPHAHPPLGIITWYKEEYNLPWGRKTYTEDMYSIITGDGNHEHTLQGRNKKNNKKNQPKILIMYIHITAANVGWTERVININNSSK